jgi:hypothetical protein
MVGITPQMGLNFALYETFKTLASGVDAVDADGKAVPKQKDSFLKGTALKGLCGGAAGGLSKLTVYPLVRALKVFVFCAPSAEMIYHVYSLFFPNAAHACIPPSVTLTCISGFRTR